MTDQTQTGCRMPDCQGGIVWGARAPRPHLRAGVPGSATIASMTEQWTASHHHDSPRGGYSHQHPDGTPPDGPLDDDAPTCETCGGPLTAQPVWVCDNCGEVGLERDDPVTLYECGEDGTVFTRDDSADGMSHRCPDCNRFSALKTEAGCPDCNEGELEETDGFYCAQCDTATTEVAASDNSKAGAIVYVYLRPWPWHWPEPGMTGGDEMMRRLGDRWREASDEMKALTYETKAKHAPTPFPEDSCYIVQRDPDTVAGLQAWATKWGWEIEVKEATA